MKYIKKPIPIEAYKTDKEKIIHTLKGDMKVNIGDYIITGVNGDNYPCKPDIFEKTYDEVSKETKVTQEEVDDNMLDVICHTAVEFDKPVTYVTVRMKNGFTLRESTTCVDSCNYNEEIGKQICLKKIEDKIWFLLGYALQDKIRK